MISYFVFRNNTIERFFPKDYTFSGYDDISFIPEDVEGYIWFYQVPIKFNSESTAEEISEYAQKFSYVLSRISESKTIIALTMDVFYSIAFTDEDHRLTEAIQQYNHHLFSAAQEQANVKVIDFCEFTRNYTSGDIFDWKYYFISQMGINPRLSKDFQKWFSQKLQGIALKRKKCLILDLDNTLWGGVLGEDGIEGIKIGGDYPGKAFMYFQKGLLELSNSGIILTVCSKNNESDVLEAWEKNPFMVLRKENFAAYRINWTDKATNIQELAEELNIGLDSMVFIDDNPTERELIRQMLPMVEVPDFPEQPYLLPAFFKDIVNRYFQVYSITEEDRKKTEQYKANASRARERIKFQDYDEYLKSLDIRMTIEPANEFNIQRIAQMTQKTNQFNLTTRRYTDSDIRSFIQKGGKIWCLSVADRFGDNGITGCIMIDGNRIDNLLLSCRILGKGIEFAFVNSILSILNDYGVSSIEAEYIPTAKNAQVAEFYDKCGFLLSKGENNGEKHYQLNLQDKQFPNTAIYTITIKTF